MLNTVDQFFTPRVVHTIIAAVIVLLATIISYWPARRFFDTKKQRIKYRSRLIYIAVCIFLILMTQIWVEGVSHVFTMLGLVAAGLVVTNKESIMNFMGFLVITWRGIFTEGDFIQVQNYSGYVDKIRPFYFSIYETTSFDCRSATGKSIKIPNGQILTNAISVFSPETDFLLVEHCFVISFEADCAKVLQVTKALISDVLKKYNLADGQMAKHHHLLKFHKTLASLIKFEPRVYVKLNYAIGKGLAVYINYYANTNSRDLIETEFWQQLPRVLSEIDVAIIV